MRKNLFLITAVAALAAAFSTLAGTSSPESPQEIRREIEQAVLRPIIGPALQRQMYSRALVVLDPHYSLEVATAEEDRVAFTVFRVTGEERVAGEKPVFLRGYYDRRARAVFLQDDETGAHILAEEHPVIVAAHKKESEGSPG